MPKKIILIIIAIIFVAGAGYLIYSSVLKKTPEDQPIGSPQDEEQKITIDPLNAVYLIEGEEVTLVNGKSEKETVSGSASKITTMAFGVPTKGDLNSDGIEDAVLILAQNTGGSGTFYYVVADVYNKTKAEAIGTNGILLGDRIAPQNVLIQGGTIVANYADRKKGEPMSIQPSVGVTKYLGVKEDGQSELLFEKPNTEKFNEYFQEAYLAKLPAGSKFDPFNIIKTTVFSAGEQFCTSLTMKKDIPAGTFATAVSNLSTKQDVQPKGTFPQALKQGGSVGCENLGYSTGVYELKIYIDDVLVAVLPFEVK